jgi:hypothetical protein
MPVRITATVRNVGTAIVAVQVRGGVQNPRGGLAWSNYSSGVELKPGDSKQFVIDVPAAPTEAGTWKAIVEVYDVVDKKVIATATKEFTVTKQVSVSIDKVEIIY